MKKITVASLALAVICASSASAGNLKDTAFEREVEQVEVVTATGVAAGSLKGTTVLALAALAALAFIATKGDSTSGTNNG